MAMDTPKEAEKEKKPGPDIWKKRFVQVPAWVFHYKNIERLKGSHALVYLVLCKYANNISRESGTRHVTISKDAGVALRSISQITSELAAMDMIKKRRNGGRVFYKILFEPTEVLFETGIHWAPDPLPKKTDFQKDPKTGRFASEKAVVSSSEEFGSPSSGEFGMPLESAHKSREGSLGVGGTSHESA